MLPNPFAPGQPLVADPFAAMPYRVRAMKMPAAAPAGQPPARQVRPVPRSPFEATPETDPNIFPQAAVQGAPSLLSGVLPLGLLAWLGRGDPRAMAAGLAGFQRGVELRRAERESVQQRNERRRREIGEKQLACS